MQDLASAGILAIGIRAEDSAYTDAEDHEHRQVAAVTLANGGTSRASDIWFKTEPVRRSIILETELYLAV